ncbi:Uu.00g038940.m01.CDS01 [Anthostomella pinea]|uniref:Uu.00g038940.m01.CDS01 n=1 Tax=Anthostomella pinea TaxID=933095 RepID=A0AAI8VAY4_9PEZI|nr:Uu.00g038940.m01.CDS01 [Anthostomella pinea]
MSGQLPTLPAELLSLVFEHADRGSLSRIARCSRYLYEVAAPFLYRHIELAGLTSKTQSVGRVTAVATLLLRRPDLASCVRHCRFIPGARYSWGNLDPEIDVSEETADQDLEARLGEVVSQSSHAASVKDAITAASHSTREHIDWLKKAEPDVKGAWHEDSLLALVLPRLSNLETLRLDHFACERTRQMLLRVAGGEKPFDAKPALTRLEYIVFHASRDVWMEYGRLFTPVFLIPSVRAIYHSASTTKPGSHEYNEQGIPDKVLADSSPGSSGCTHLELHACRLSAVDMRNMLAKPKGLETFIYTVAPPVEHAPIAVSYPALWRALLLQSETLENIWIDDFRREGWIELDEDDYDPIRTFKDFPRLKRLRIPDDNYFSASLDNLTGGDDDLGGGNFEDGLTALPAGLEVPWCLWKDF